MEERDGEKEEREIGNGEQEEEEEEIMEEVQKTAAEDETTTEEEVVEQRSGVLEEGKSFWQPYLDTLPSVLHTTLFFSEQELDDLQTSMVTSTAHYMHGKSSCGIGFCAGEGVCNKAAECSQKGDYVTR